MNNRASSKCWICGEDEPHTHSQDEVERARVCDTYADVIEPFVKSNYVMDETSRWHAKRIADALIDAGLAPSSLTSETVPANEDEAGRGLNDTFPGDPYPVAGVLQGIRQRSVQAMHAGISRRDWWATEVAANELRDRIDDLIRRLGTYSVSSSKEL